MLCIELVPSWYYIVSESQAERDRTPVTVD